MRILAGLVLMLLAYLLAHQNGYIDAKRAFYLGMFVTGFGLVVYRHREGGIEHEQAEHSDRAGK